MTEFDPSILSNKFIHSEQRKDSIFQALEELRMRRVIDNENTQKIKHLLADNLEIHRQKDEYLCKSETEIKMIQRKLEDANSELAIMTQKIQQQEDKKLNDAAFDSKGAKILKEEVISLQLAKYGLEKKLKEQECHFDMQMKARENMKSRIQDLHERLQAIEGQRDTMQKEILRMESDAHKASLFQNRIIRINRHQRCEIENCKEIMNRSSKELIEIKAKQSNTHGNARLDMECISSNSVEQGLEKNPFIEQLESQVALLKKENTNLLEMLEKQSNLVNRLNARLATVSTSEMALQLELDDLKSEHRKVKSVEGNPDQHQGEQKITIMDGNLDIKEEVNAEYALEASTSSTEKGVKCQSYFLEEPELPTNNDDA